MVFVCRTVCLLTAAKVAFPDPAWVSRQPPLSWVSLRERRMESLKTLYLIDDDMDDLDFFCEAVQQVDSSIICFKSSDSEYALRSFQQGEIPLPDLIFLDLNMPLIDGRTFLCEIKKIDEYASIPVIIYSTSAHPKDIDDTRKLGAAGFITKPFSQEVLVNQLQILLRQHSHHLTRSVEVSGN